MADSDAYLKTVQTIYEAFGRGDVPAILDTMTDDVAWDLDAPGYGVPIYEPGSGKAHVAKFFAALADLEFLNFQPTNFLVGGNQVAVTIDVEVTVKATGKTVKALEIHLWTFNDSGKIERFFHSIDRQAFVLAYGV